MTTPTTRERLAALGVTRDKLAHGDMVRVANELGVRRQRVDQLLPPRPQPWQPELPLPDLIDRRTACWLLGARQGRKWASMGKTWFYAHVAPVLTQHPADWDRDRPLRRQPQQIRRGRPTGWGKPGARAGKILYERQEVEALRDLRQRMLAEADTRYLPWLLVLKVAEETGLAAVQPTI